VKVDPCGNRAQKQQRVRAFKRDIRAKEGKNWEKESGVALGTKPVVRQEVGKGVR